MLRVPLQAPVNRRPLYVRRWLPLVRATKLEWEAQTPESVEAAAIQAMSTPWASPGAGGAAPSQPADGGKAVVNGTEHATAAVTPLLGVCAAMMPMASAHGDDALAGAGAPSELGASTSEADADDDTLQVTGELEVSVAWLQPALLPQQLARLAELEQQSQRAWPRPNASEPQMPPQKPEARPSADDPSLSEADGSGHQASATASTSTWRVQPATEAQSAAGATPQGEVPARWTRQRSRSGMRSGSAGVRRTPSLTPVETEGGLTLPQSASGDRAAGDGSGEGGSGSTVQANLARLQQEKSQLEAEVRSLRGQLERGAIQPAAPPPDIGRAGAAYGSQPALLSDAKAREAAASERAAVAEERDAALALVAELQAEARQVHKTIEAKDAELELEKARSAAAYRRLGYRPARAAGLASAPLGAARPAAIAD